MSKKFNTEHIGQFVEGFNLFQGTLNGDAESPLGIRRREAFERFAANGFPTTRHEEWKYTNVSPIERTHFRPVLTPEESSASDAFGTGFEGDAFRLVFVNGHFSPERSSIEGLPEGVIVTNLAKAIRENTELVSDHIAGYPDTFEHAFAALNTAHIRDGAFVFVPKNVVLEKPVFLCYLTDAEGDPVVTYPRTLLVAETGAEATVVEEFAGREGDVYLTNAVAEIVVGENARVDHVVLQHQSHAAYHVAASHARLQRNSNYFNNIISFGGKIARNDPAAVLGGEGGHASLDGMYLVSQDQLIDSHTAIDHAMPHCTSHELYKGILRDNGHGVFNGKIFVRKDAQKTDSKQSNTNLLLSDSAAIDTKPQLEIFADDVKCTHGATIGRLDDSSVFYLRARGIGKEDARKMLVYAFAAEIVEHVRNEDVRAYAATLLDQRLEK